MKYLGVVSYCGNAYSGFERQKDKKTIQGTLEKELSFLLGVPTFIKGAGRTDSKVNAEGQTFSFEAKPIENVGRFLDALNRLLPRDIEMLRLEDVPDEFDARHSSCGKRYRYRFSYGSKMPFETSTVAYIGNRNDFDEAAFLEAIRLYEGEHRFHNFTTKKDDKDDFVRFVHIESAWVDGKKRQGEVVFVANGFMTYMVRFLVGAAFKAAFHTITIPFLKERIDSEERRIMSFKAPPEGLTLLEVLYHESYR